jgi:hypothetical protein
MGKVVMIDWLKIISEDLQLRLDNSEKMWQDKENHAKIIGYLQASLEMTMDKLNNLTKK